MTIVKHRGHTVETETVETIFLKPILAVGKQEVQHLVLSIVETKAVPSRMLTTLTLAEVLTWVAGKVCQAFHLVLHCMAMNNIHHYSNAHAVSRINQRLQFVGRAEATAGSKETAYVVTETAIIGMLLYGHNLNAVVTVGCNTRKNLITELYISANLFLVLSHTNVALIDKQRICRRTELLHLPLIGLLRIPYLSTENMRLGRLDNSSSPSRNTFSLTTLPMHNQFIERTMLEGLVLYLDFPVSCRTLHALHRIAGAFLPSVEIANNINLGGIGCPFAKHITILCLVKTEVEIATRKLIEVVRARSNLCHLTRNLVMTAIDGISKD